MKKFNSFLAVLLSLTMVLSFAFVSSAVVFAGAPTPNADKLVKYLNAQEYLKLQLKLKIFSLN